MLKILEHIRSQNLKYFYMKRIIECYLHAPLFPRRTFTNNIANWHEKKAQLFSTCVIGNNRPTNSSNIDTTKCFAYFANIVSINHTSFGKFHLVKIYGERLEMKFINLNKIGTLRIQL